MNRLQKKCLLISLGMHGLLLLVLVVGPAFLPASKRLVNDMPVLDFIPANLIDAAFSGGGNPSPPPPGRNRESQPPAPARVVPPAPQRAAPPPEPERVEAVPKLPKTTKINEDSLDPPETPLKKKPKPSIIEVLKPVTRPARRDRSTARETERARERESQAREAAAAEQRALLDQALNSVRGGLSGSTSIQTVGGTGVGGTGGPAYASYDQVVKTIYDRAWYAPRELENVNAQSLSVWVRVVVNRSGEIVEARIETPSGSAAFDHSIRQALDRVKSLPAFPPGVKDEQRSYKIKFDLLDLKARHSLG